MDDRRRTRRQALGVAGVAAGSLATAVLVGHEPRRADPAVAVQLGPDVRRFVSRPDLIPPRVSVEDRRAPQDRLDPAARVFVSPSPDGAGQGGAMILDPDGELVWFLPVRSGGNIANLRAQTYRGEPVLTWWEGTISHGHGDGVAVLADASYRRTHTVLAGHGVPTDLHELRLTEEGTALVTGFAPAAADLAGAGGPADGAVFSGVAQEVDVATGEVLFEWSSLDHVPVTDTYAARSGGTAKDPFDYFHINSLAVAPDGELLVSARHTCAVYKVSRRTGEVRWRLGGRRSSFAMGPGTRFYWQHDAQPLGAAAVSVFDDGAAPQREPQSRAIVLDLDLRRMRATLADEVTHPEHLLAKAMGNVQRLTGGGAFVGWGTAPHYSHFAADGRLLLDGRLPDKDGSYRAFLMPWTGRPVDRPAVAVRATDGGSTVYASWNGATEVASWVALAGPSQWVLRTVGEAPRDGFETALHVSSDGPYFAVRALDASGGALHTSPTVRSW